jgi:hypothetical protein
VFSPNEFNNIHPQLQFTVECETKNTLNFLDLSTHRQSHTIQFDIFQKPTFTYTIIPYNSCHPKEHAYAAPRYLIHRWENYPITSEAKRQEPRVLQNILHNNSFPLQIIQKLQETKDKEHKKIDNTKQKWISFTFSWNETRRITNIFKRTNLRISYKTRNNI